MRFECEEQKRQTNHAKHGVNFEAARLIFDGPTLEFLDERHDYGETRIAAYGEAGGVVLFVIYAPRGVRAAPSVPERQQPMNDKLTSRALPPKRRTIKDRTDWARVHGMTDAVIGASVAGDADTFVPDADWMSKARLVMPEAKQMVTMRIDSDVLEWFRKTGRGYQTRINAVLRAFVEAQERRARQPNGF